MEDLYIEGIYFGDIDSFENSIKDELGEIEYNKVFNGLSNNLYLDIICMPEINEFNGNKKVQLVIIIIEFQNNFLIIEGVQRCLLLY